MEKINQILSLNILNEKLKLVTKEIKSNKAKVLSKIELFME